MPVQLVKGGYKWGKSGKTYPTRKQAEKQARAIYASGWKENESTERYIHNIIMEELEKLL